MTAGINQTMYKVEKFSWHQFLVSHARTSVTLTVPLALLRLLFFSPVTFFPRLLLVAYFRPSYYVSFSEKKVTWFVILTLFSTDPSCV